MPHVKCSDGGIRRIENCGQAPGSAFVLQPELFTKGCPHSKTPFCETLICPFQNTAVPWDGQTKMIWVLAPGLSGAGRPRPDGRVARAERVVYDGYPRPHSGGGPPAPGNGTQTSNITTMGKTAPQQPGRSPPATWKGSIRTVPISPVVQSSSPPGTRSRSNPEDFRQTDNR